MDEVDKKILFYLDLDSRMPVKKIASLINEKSEKINYRVKKLFKDGVIKRCYAEVNPWKIGYTSFKVYFQFQGVNKSKIDEMYEFLIKNCNVGWAATCLGRWDMIVEIMARDRHEFVELYSRFHRRYYEHILYKVVGVTLERIFLNKKWLAPGISDVSVSVMTGHPETMVDEKDFRIIKHLAMHGRDSVKSIAEKLGIPPTTVSQRINSLVKQKIINNFRTDIDLKRFGKAFCKSFIYFSGAGEEEQKQLIKYCIRHPEIVFITKCIAPWDMEIEAHTSSFNDFTEMMNDLKNRFPGVLRNFEAVVINKETGNVSLPHE